MQLSEYMNIETSAFGTAQKNLNQYSIRRVARPLKFDIYNTCKPSCTFLFRTLILLHILPITFHVLAFLACEESPCTNAQHKIFLFNNSYHSNQQSW